MKVILNFNQVNLLANFTKCLNGFSQVNILRIRIPLILSFRSSNLLSVAIAIFWRKYICKYVVTTKIPRLLGAYAYMYVCGFHKKIKRFYTM